MKTRLKRGDSPKVFGQKVAVDSLDLDVSKGSVFGLFRVNGAGKTTSVRMIVGHLRPTAGEVRLLRSDPWRHSEADRRHITYVSDNMNMTGWMTPEQAIQFNAPFYPRWNATLAKRLLHKFQLFAVGHYQSLSRGQKCRLCLLLAICQNADVLVLDEPAAGVDVVARHEFLNLIMEQVCDGERTVFLSSHLLSDLERVVGRITILRHGRLHLSGELDSLKTSVRKIHLPISVPPESLAEYFEVIRHNESVQETVATILNFDEDRFRVLCEKHGCTVLTLKIFLWSCSS